LVSVRIVKGTLFTSLKYERSQEYVIKNSGDRAKKVLIEQPYDPSWKLVAPEKPAEKTRDLYRFAVEAQPGKAATLKVAEEQVVQQQLAITNVPDWQIRVYASAKVVSDNVKKALAEIVRQKQELERVAREQANLQAQINTISSEQTRIRENMRELDRNSELYQRYVKKFSDQEDQIEKLRDQVQTLQQQVDQKQRALDDYIRGLDIS
jgi:predicted RNase H-like nuclease (RuvC/YqgF family)